ncbi:unnamed protein product, partial [Staurois parvus]
MNLSKSIVIGYRFSFTWPAHHHTDNQDIFKSPEFYPIQGRTDHLESQALPEGPGS